MNLRTDYVKGAATGFFTAFAVGLLASPVDGRTARRETIEKTKLLINCPSKLAAFVRGRKQKLHEFGRGRLQFLQGEADSLKEEAQTSATSEYYNHNR